MNAFENVLAHNRNATRGSATVKRGKTRSKIRVKAAEVVNFLFAAVFAAIGGGLMYAGFHILDIRQKNLGYINVTVAIAVIAGAAFIAICVAAVARGARSVRAGKR